MRVDGSGNRTHISSSEVKSEFEVATPVTHIGIGGVMLNQDGRVVHWQSVESEIERLPTPRFDS